MTTPPAGGPGNGWSVPETGGGTAWGPAPGAPTTPGPRPVDAPGTPGGGAPVPGSGPPRAQGWGQLTGDGPQPYGSVLARRGIIALKPLGFGDFFDGAFRAIRHNPRAMIGLSALVLGVTNLLVALPLGALASTPGFTGDASAEPSTAEIAGLLGGVVALVPLTFLQGVAITVLTGMLILSVTQSVVDRRLSIGELWRRAKGRVWPLIGWSFLVSIAGTLVLGLALAPALVLLVVEELIGGFVALGLGIVLFALVAAWLYVKLVFVPVLIVVERLGIVASVRRSFALTRRAFWWTLLVLLLTAVLTAVVTQLLSAPFVLLGTLGLFVQESQPLLGTIIYVGGTVVGSTVGFILATPFAAAVVALLYVDRRIRLEGLDVALARTLEDEHA